MKIRQGFVSNSSSSSFCIIGVRIDSDKADEVKLAETLGLMSMNDKEDHPDWESNCSEVLMDNDYVCDKELEPGYTVIGINNTACESNSRINVDKALDELNKMGDALGIKASDIDAEDVNIYFGERYC